MANVIAATRKELEEWWEKCYYSEEQRNSCKYWSSGKINFHIIFNLVVMFLSALHGMFCNSDEKTEEVLECYEREVEKVKKYYEQYQDMLEKVARRQKLWGDFLEFEVN